MDPYEEWIEKSEALWNERAKKLRAEMKHQCIWCGALREPNAERELGETVPEILERRLGPRGCSAPDGDGHSWNEYTAPLGSRDQENDERRKVEET